MTDELFWSRVLKTETCWLWIGALNKGYGHLTRNDRSIKAHRYAYELLIGPIPEGMELDHVCRIKACVRPDPEHCEPVPHRLNVLRGESPAAAHAVQTHCIHGHEFTPANTYIPPKKPNARDCRTCARERQRRYARAA